MSDFRLRYAISLDNLATLMSFNRLNIFNTKEALSLPGITRETKSVGIEASKSSQNLPK